MAKNPERGGGILVPALISVLATVAISAGGFGAGYGAGVLRYEVLGDVPQAQQEQTQQNQPTATALQSSAVGPNLIVENGTITWMSESWLAHGGRSVPGFETWSPEPDTAPSTQQQPADDAQNDTQAPAQTEPQQIATQPQSQGAASQQKQPAAQTSSSNNGTSSGGVVSITPNQTQTNTPSTNTSQSNRTKANGDGTYTHDFSGGKVLATLASDNKGDPVYHTRDCASAKKIAPDDVIWYDSAEAAARDNRRPCKRC